MNGIPEYKTCVVIGGGLGGLFTGAILARNGIKVTVLEKNIIPGGGLQCFRRGDKIFETGMHILGGFGQGGSLNKICRYLGILDKLDIKPVDRDCMDEIYVESGDETLRIAPGREGFVRSLSDIFPHCAEEIKRYTDALYRLSEEVPLFYLRKGESPFNSHSDEFTMAADEFISKYISDPRLRDIAAYFNPLYGGVKGETPAYIHALISVLYINGPSRFAGGSQQLAEALAGVIRLGGGDVICGEEVTSINLESDGKAASVTASDGKEFFADCFVSAVNPICTVKMLPHGVFKKAYITRLESLPLSVSAFSLYIDLKPDTVRYINHTCYYIDDYDAVWNQYTTEDSRWPAAMMYMTPPERNQGKYASRLLVHCVMPWTKVEQWKDSRLGQRPEAYIRWKNEITHSIMNRLDRVMPGIMEKVNKVYASSPLTIRDYYHTPDGALFGFRKDCRNLLLSQIPVYTKVSNLFHTGQNINLHGICGVPLTAILSAEAVLGADVILDQINQSTITN